MTHPKQDNAILGIFQEANEEGDDVLRTLLKHTIQEVLDEEFTCFFEC